MERPADGERPDYRVLKLSTIAWISLIVLVVGVGTATWLILAYGRGAPHDSLEAIKTAGTIVAGAGGAVALWLAARRQRTTEIALKQKDLELEQNDRDQRHAALDATERRITELYTMAAAQLGSDRAAMRLAGIYALERLAQNNVDQRQVIANVLCGYLRMPHDPADVATSPSTTGPGPVPESGASHPDDSEQSSVRSERLGAPRTWHMIQDAQEQQVRLAIQRILAAHLRPQSESPVSVSKFWPGLDLDFSGAILVDLDLKDCHIRSGIFDGVQFRGTASFDGAQFSDTISFNGARFEGEARLPQIRCAGTASFAAAHFVRDAVFDRAEFSSITTFDHAQFGKAAGFKDVRFGRLTLFSNAAFSGIAMFNGARFVGTADFGEARYNGARFAEFASFRAAQFEGRASFAGTMFSDKALFDDARFDTFVAFSDATFDSSALFACTEFTGGARFRAATFRGDALFRWSKFDKDSDFDGALFHASTLFADAHFGGGIGCFGARARLDAPNSRPQIWPEPWRLMQNPLLG